MKEADIRLAVSHALQWRGIRPLHWKDGRVIPHQCPFCKRWSTIVIAPEIKGRPDLIGIRGKPMLSMFIEVKDVPVKEKSFRLAEIDDDQRKYLNNYYDEGGLAFIAIGNIVPMGSKTKIGEVLVVPWGIFRELFDLHKSIPWDWELYEKLPKDPPPSMKEIFPNESLWLIRDGKSWKFHPEHPIALISPEVEVPFYMRKGGSINGEIREQVKESPAKDSRDG